MQNKLYFHHVAMKFREFEKATKFFEDHFGFEVISIMKTKSGKRVASLKQNNFILEIFETFEEVHPGGPFKHLSFSVQDIRTMVKKLESKGIKFVEGVTESKDENGQDFCFAYFLGPESIKLELHEEGNCHES